MTEGQLQWNRTRSLYDRISRAYDLIADSSEHTVRDLGMQALGVSCGQRVEIGCGIGHGLVSRQTTSVTLTSTRDRPKHVQLVSRRLRDLPVIAAIGVNLSASQDGSTQ